MNANGSHCIQIDAETYDRLLKLAPALAEERGLERLPKSVAIRVIVAEAAAKREAQPMPSPTPNSAIIEGLLDKPISILDLSVRVENALRMGNVFTMRDIVRLPTDLHERLPGFGKTSLGEVQRKLAKVGLSLGMRIDESQERAE